MEIIYRDIDAIDVYKRIECQNAVETAILSYLTNMENKMNNPGTSQKSYWKIINRVMNKCRAPTIFKQNNLNGQRRRYSNRQDNSDGRWRYQNSGRNGIPDEGNQIDSNKGYRSVHFDDSVV